MSMDLKFDAARDLKDVGAEGIPLSPQVMPSTCQHLHGQDSSPGLCA